MSSKPKKAEREPTMRRRAPIRKRKPKSEKPKRKKREKKEPHPDALCFSLEDAGARLGISRRSVWNLIVSGNLESIKILSRRMVTREAIDEFLAAESEAES